MSSQPLPRNDPRLLIIADNLLARAGLAALLGERGWMVAAQSDGDSLIADAERLQPDILVIDLGWQTGELTEALASLAGVAPVLALVGEDETDETLGSLWRVLSSSASFAVLPRESELDAIDAALRALVHGLVVLDPAYSALPIAAAQPPSGAPATPLTAREREVLQLLAQGLTNRAIALTLGITEHTVKFHVNAIMTKLDAQSRTEAVVRATRLGMIVL